MSEPARLRELRRAVDSGNEVLAVHYACEPLSEATDHPAAISCIAIANLGTGTREAFSLADQPSDVELREREVDLLRRFYGRLAGHREARIVHWNMNSSTFGFAALARRFRYLTSEEIPYSPPDHLLYDLDDIVVAMHGESYVQHPKMYNLASLNEINLHSFLLGRAEAEAFKKNDFGAVASSTLTKSRIILEFLNSLLAGRLRTQTSAGSIVFAGGTIDAVEAVLSIAHKMRDVERELRRRYSNRPTLTVSDEYDYQDLLKALLALFFDDVRPESWTPSVAGGASRIDFLIPALELAIEVKRTRSSMTSKSLADELIIDRDRYRSEGRAKHLICLVFDYDGLLPGPRGLEADLARGATTEGLAVTVRIFDR